jgi:hypothetical protein
MVGLHKNAEIIARTPRGYHTRHAPRRHSLLVPTFLFSVVRRCPEGRCADGPCECIDPTTDVDVDELTAEELAHFSAQGTPAQRAEIEMWLATPADPHAELLAGQRDVFPELTPAG